MIQYFHYLTRVRSEWKHKTTSPAYSDKQATVETIDNLEHRQKWNLYTSTIPNCNTKQEWEEKQTMLSFVARVLWKRRSARSRCILYRLCRPCPMINLLIVNLTFIIIIFFYLSPHGNHESTESDSFICWLSQHWSRTLLNEQFCLNSFYCLIILHKPTHLSLHGSHQEWKWNEIKLHRTGKSIWSFGYEKLLASWSDWNSI